MGLALARSMIGLQRERDSAIVQLVLVREKVSVAAAKREISVVFCWGGMGAGEDAGSGGVDGSAWGGGGVGGGVGYDDCGFDEGDVEDVVFCRTLIRFSIPRTLGIR